MLPTFEPELWVCLSDGIRQKWCCADFSAQAFRHWLVLNRPTTTCERSPGASPTWRGPDHGTPSVRHAKEPSWAPILFPQSCVEYGEALPTLPWQRCPSAANWINAIVLNVSLGIICYPGADNWDTHKDQQMHRTVILKRRAICPVANAKGIADFCHIFCLSIHGPAVEPGTRPAALDFIFHMNILMYMLSCKVEKESKFQNKITPCPLLLKK